MQITSVTTLSSNILIILTVSKMLLVFKRLFGGG